ncbi:glycosyltransferase [Pseudophaeobacter arcticus]
MQKDIEMLNGIIGRNPYRKSAGLGSVVKKIAQFIVGSSELFLVLNVPLYRAWLRRRISRPLDLLVIGAQKSGTTWVHAQLQDLCLANVAGTKECHHFDRGRMWSIRRYITQYADAKDDLPLVEVAPDYGPMPRWRIAAIRSLFPNLRIAFIARNPIQRAWSGTRMETAFDRGWTLDDVPVRDLVHHLLLGRSRRYSDYATQMETWEAVFGAHRVRLYPFEHISENPEYILKDLLDHAGGPVPDTIEGLTPEVFPGKKTALPEAVKTLLIRYYGREIDRFEAFLGSDADTNTWRPILDKWRREAGDLILPPEKERTLLFLCGFSPNPKANSSGQKLAYAKIVALAERFKAVSIIYFVNDLDALDSFEDVWPANVAVAAVIRVHRNDQIKGLLKTPVQPIFASARRMAGHGTLETLLKDPKFTDFYADFTQGLAALSPVDFPLFTFRQHDVVSKLYDRQASQLDWKQAWFYEFQSRRAQAWQLLAWDRVMRLRTLSPDDARDIKALFPRQEAEAEAVRGTINTEGMLRTADSIVPGRIAFWGNMARHENVDAVIHFTQNILPRVREEVPLAHLWIVGAHPTQDVLALEGEYVHVTGFIEDPVEIFTSLDVAIAPLRLGSGVKIKVFETIDAGIPTVVSPVGGEGIEDHPLLHVAQSDEDFVISVAEILKKSTDPESMSRRIPHQKLR